MERNELLLHPPVLMVMFFSVDVVQTTVDALWKNFPYPLLTEVAGTADKVEESVGLKLTHDRKSENSEKPIDVVQQVIEKK